MIETINKNGEKEKTALYCMRCGEDICTYYLVNIGWYATCKCGLETPLFRNQLSAIKYYKDNYGLKRKKA